MPAPNSPQAQNADQPKPPSSKLFYMVLMAVLTGGLSLVWHLALHLPALLRKGWEARAHYSLAGTDSNASPWPWIGRSWISFLAASLVSQLVLFGLGAILTLSLGGLAPGNKGRAFLMAGQIVAWPQILVLLIILGQGGLLLAHTLTHALGLPRVARIASIRMRRFLPKGTQA